MGCFAPSVSGYAVLLPLPAALNEVMQIYANEVQHLGHRGVVGVSGRPGG